MKYKIVFSIPIHEKFEVVLDQTLNYLTLNADCAIVYHISQGFDEKNSKISRLEFESIISQYNGVYINPTSVRTGFGDIIQAHISNYRFVSTIIDFEFFSMCASNELFVKTGLYDVIKNYDCGVGFFTPKDRPEWAPAYYAEKDSCLKKIMADVGVSSICPSNIEGSFYSKSIFLYICDSIEKYYDYLEMKVKYPREEVYFSTILCAIKQKNPELRVYPKLFTLVHWNIGKICYNNMYISVPDILKCRKKGNSFYSVKRVDRIINDPRRAFIRQICGYYESLKKEYHDIRKQNYVSIMLKDALDSFGLKWKFLKAFIKKGSLTIKPPIGRKIENF